MFALVGLAGCSTSPAGGQDAAAPATSQAAAPSEAVGASDGTFTGTVAESINAGGYTYVRLQSGSKDVWVAATEIPVEKGERLTVSLDMPMQNFHSTALDRDFELVYFVSYVGRGGETAAAGAGTRATGSPMPAASHGSAPVAASGPVAVQPSAPPAGGLAIADVWTRRSSLAGKAVTVRGTVVKVNNGILDRNWIHLQDGSGSASDGTNDLTVTTAAVVRLGDVITVTGTLQTGKDFGAGYAYEAILEDAVVK